MDLRDASHEQAVEAIRNAANPVVFLVQSIIHKDRVSITHTIQASTDHGKITKSIYLSFLTRVSVYNIYMICILTMAG